MVCGAIEVEFSVEDVPRYNDTLVNNFEGVVFNKGGDSAPFKRGRGTYRSVRPGVPTGALLCEVIRFL